MISFGNEWTEMKACHIISSKNCNRLFVEQPIFLKACSSCGEVDGEFGFNQFSYKLAGFGLNTEIMLINSLVSESPGLWPEERQLIPETFLLKLGVVFMTGWLGAAKMGLSIDLLM